MCDDRGRRPESRCRRAVTPSRSARAQVGITATDTGSKGLTGSHRVTDSLASGLLDPQGRPVGKSRATEFCRNFERR